MAKDKKTVFDENVDSSINGISVILTFVVIGVFLTVYPSYFGNILAGKIIRILFIIIGTIGIISETQKTKSKIKGTGDFILGLVVLLLWALLFFKFKNTVINIISFFLLILGLFGGIKGVLQIGYSLKLYIKQQNKTNLIENHKSDIILFFTKLLGLILVVAQIIKIAVELYPN